MGSVQLLIGGWPTADRLPSSCLLVGNRLQNGCSPIAKQLPTDCRASAVLLRRVPAYHSSQPQLARGSPGGPRGDQASRPLSTLVSPREQEQYASGMGFPAQRPAGLSPKRNPGRPPEGGTHPPQRPPMPAEMR